MKNVFLSIVLVFFLVSCSTKSQKKMTYYKAMTYNIRYDNPNDAEDNWDKRKAELAAQIKENAPDFLGTQEGLVHQLTYLDSVLINYAIVGVGREDGKTKGEYTALYYDKNKWNCLQNDTFWLSTTTPDVVSVGWDAALERICTYALLENTTTKKKVWVFNAHFDHQGMLAREKSARLILSQIAKKQQEFPASIILMGDFNVMPEDKPIQLFAEKLTDSFTDKALSQGTFNAFNTEQESTARIDYIFTQKLKVKKCEILTKKRQNGRFISDHFPVLTWFYL